jgi:hypothetical protein
MEFAHENFRGSGKDLRGLGNIEKSWEKVENCVWGDYSLVRLMHYALAVCWQKSRPGPDSN